jgi:hypothetical protein
MVGVVDVDVFNYKCVVLNFNIKKHNFGVKRNDEEIVKVKVNDSAQWF